MGLAPVFVALIVVLGGSVALIEFTHGLAILSAALFLVAFFVWKRRRAQRELALQEAALQERLRRGSTIDGMLSVTPGQFEQLVAEILVNLGFSDVSVVGGSGDEGADVRALDSTGRQTVVQCKQYRPQNVIGSPAVQLLLGARTHFGASRALLVTTSSFSGPAIRYARQNEIELVDGSVLADWARQALHNRALLDEGMSEGSSSSEASPPAAERSIPDLIDQAMREPGVWAGIAAVVLVLGLTLGGWPKGTSTSNATASQTKSIQSPSSSATSSSGSALKSTSMATTTATSATPTTIDQSQAVGTAVDQSALVQDDIATLNDDGQSIEDATQPLSADSATLAQDLQTTLADDQKTHSDAGSASTSDLVCGDASTVGGDASTVAGDESILQGDASTFQAATSGVPNNEAMLRADEAKLLQDESGLPPSALVGMASQSQVNSDLAGIDAAVATGKQQMAAALSTAQADVGQAQSYANDAQAACSAG